nr:EOG090X0CTK [Eulimnadia texana]
MTLYHFGNCLALAYAPYWIVYKHCGLSEYNAFWKCVHSGFIYALTQLAKMLLLATFFPSFDATDGNETVNLITEFLRCTVDIADLVGLAIVMSRVTGKSNTKVLVAGIGWAAAEFVFSRLLVLWVGARGVEFDWRYIQQSFESNISLVHFLAVAALVWLYSRNDLPKTLLPAVIILLSLHCYQPLIMGILTTVIHVSSWTLLFIKASCTVVMAVVTLHLYGGVAINYYYYNYYSYNNNKLIDTTTFTTRTTITTANYCYCYNNMCNHYCYYYYYYYYCCYYYYYYYYYHYYCHYYYYHYHNDYNDYDYDDDDD